MAYRPIDGKLAELSPARTLLSAEISARNVLLSRYSVVTAVIGFVITFAINFCINWFIKSEDHPAFSGSTSVLTSVLIGSTICGMLQIALQARDFKKHVNELVTVQGKKIVSVAELAATFPFNVSPIIRIRSLFLRALVSAMQAIITWSGPLLLIFTAVCKSDDSMCTIRHAPFCVLFSLLIAFQTMIMFPFSFMAVIYHETAEHDTP
eukprot:TRINITY_DN1339_c0_g1_i1.p1 TRINITY_DN1339_c0_g1~~TRINITY_DN1339_c0_g1_i1.p1  ORF type:complete len:208 (-),score=15.71 TRINITY_DN1339_c0_g1_i1:35-658(-)